jgi:hypothetical protein
VALELRRGRVTAIAERVDGLVRLDVEGRPCIAYPRLTGPVAVGDDVVVNVQAVELALGSGGFDVLHVNLTRGLALQREKHAHVMKLPYTSIQHAVRHLEEDAELPETLSGLPVVCCSLHSQVAPACAGLGCGRRVAYVQLPGGALPVSLSDAVRALRRRSLLAATVAVGACVDGEVAAVTPAAALSWCAAEGFDAAVCAIGPGIVGTGSALGHGGLAAADAALAARSLGGRPIVAARLSERDPRERHRGLSHHTAAVLLLAGAVELAWPADAPNPPAGAVPVEVDGWREACDGLPLSHMGRSANDDPSFFAAAFAAGRLARADR